MPDDIIVVKLYKSYLSIMKVASFKIFFLVNFLILCNQASTKQLTAHEYAERTHNNIIEIIQTKNQLTWTMRMDWAGAY